MSLKSIRTRRLSFLTTFALLLTGVYFVLSPFIPTLTAHAPQSVENYKNASPTAIAAIVQGKLPDTPPPLVQKVNSLIIPSIGVDYHVLEGTEEKILDRGFWHRPKSSTPDKGGNTVIAGHRYQYISGPRTLFHLDKVKVGDSMSVVWEGREYVYEVIETKVVPPTAVEIEHNTDESILTVYTCTPVFTTKDRLVVVGKLKATAMGDQF